MVKHYVNLGIAAATDRGLLVPTSRTPRTCHCRAGGGAGPAGGDRQGGKTTPADMADGTITITNVGVFGVDAGTPILTPGEVAILAFGQIRDMPWVHEGEIKIRKVTTLALSFDHRVVDGELGSAFLRDVGRHAGGSSPDARLVLSSSSREGRPRFSWGRPFIAFAAPHA